MRKAYQDVSIVRNEEKNNELIGVSLGYDYCAEHEWGIKGIKREFGFDNAKIGIEGRSITKGGVLYKEKGNLALIRNSDNFQITYNKLDEKNFDECLPRDLQHLREDKEIHTAWAEDNFCVVGPVDVIKQLKEAFDNKNICFATINSMPAFGGTSLCILIKDRVPQEAVDSMAYVDNKAKDLVEYENKIGISKLKEKVFKSVHNNDFDSTKHKYWMALSPRWINYNNENPETKKKDNTEYDIAYWVNYGDNETYGWFTVEQIKQWLENQDVKLASLGGTKSR
jgi:hypothetical protein